ncbi:MAG: hypothetical protein WAN36_15705 [Calditrichia bacterium]
MKRIIKYLISLIILLSGMFLTTCSSGQTDNSGIPAGQNWTHYVRIGGHGLSLERVDSIIKDAQTSNMFGIETDNDITGRYDSFLDPTEKLKAIKAVAEKAHAIDNYAFVYIAGLECITNNADQKEHSFFKDHPDWVQRNISGEPAMFGGGTAFWISEGDEDVWISPYPEEWREHYMGQVRQIAATGIDGIYVDIPYWMTHFEGWEDTWASFDQYTVAAFQKETGLNAKTDLKLGDFRDPNFRKWVDFRIKTLTEFMADIDKNAKSVNPECMTIAEIYPGYGEDAVRVGADVYDMYPAVDAIAHEYSAGGYTAVKRNPKDWFNYMIGMYTFRAFAEDKASWMLSYSWDDSKKMGPQESMKNLALSQVMAGTNFWDARGHVMSGSNDLETRKEIFNWIATNEKTLYLPREAINPVGIYFSPKTRDYFTDEFFKAYTGIMQLMLQSHQEFQIVTPRTLADFSGDVLILPDVKSISDAEVQSLQKLFESGTGLMVSGETGRYDETGAARTANPVHQLLGISDIEKAQTRTGKFIFNPASVGVPFLQETRSSFDEAAWEGDSRPQKLAQMQNEFLTGLEQTLGHKSTVEVNASPYITSQIARVDGKIHIFIANFKGLKGEEVDRQLPEKNVKITFPRDAGSTVYLLPFLGQKQQLEAQKIDGSLAVTIPAVDKGAVVWVE